MSIAVNSRVFEDTVVPKLAVHQMYDDKRVISCGKTGLLTCEYPGEISVRRFSNASLSRAQAASNSLWARYHHRMYDILWCRVPYCASTHYTNTSWTAPLRGLEELDFSESVDR